MDWHKHILAPFERIPRFRNKTTQPSRPLKSVLESYKYYFKLSISFDLLRILLIVELHSMQLPQIMALKCASELPFHGIV
jgi:hypothetical protein